MINESLEHMLTTWLEDDADRRVPDHLDSVLAATATARQRRLGSAPWPSWIGRSRVLAIAGLVALAAASVTVLGIGRQRPHNVPVPTTSGVNGIILVNIGGDIYELDAAGSNPRALVVGPTFDFGAVFSPDGSRFAFQQQHDSFNLEIGVASVGGPGQTVVLETRWDDSRGYAWSPDGEQLAILHHPDASSDVLSIVDVDDPTSARDVPLPGDIYYGHFAFGLQVGWASSDELILTGGPRRGASGQGIYAIRPDGSGFREIVRSALYDYVGLSADGRWLTYFEYLHDGHVVGARSHLVEVATGDDRILSSGHGSWDQELVFSPAGTTGAMVACLEGFSSCDLVIVSLDGSAPARVIGPGHGPTPKERRFIYSPDGRKIVLSWSDLSRSDSPTLVIDVETGKQTDLGDGMWIEAWQSLPLP